MSKKLKNTWNIRREFDSDDEEEIVQPPAAPVETKVIDDMTLPAVHVAVLNDVKEAGRLYYVTSLNQFSMRVGTLTLRGNVGKVFVNDATPSKTRKCKYGNRCSHPETCEYYHDPAINCFSYDIRNYSASSWFYAPGRPKCKKIGSRERFECDMIELKHDDVDLMQDMLMHDILCGMLINKYYTEYLKQ